MIITNGLTKKYKNITAVDSVNLQIKENETFALLGLNGAGKTTLIKMLCTLTTVTSGNATICGYDLKTEQEKIKPILNISPQESAVAKNLTTKENLLFVASLYGISKELANQKAEELLKEFDLVEKSNVRAKNLSGGQMRRLSIALAIISEPKLLFLDEPTLGLDVKARKKLWSIIEKLKSKVTIILTTHYLEEVEYLADRVGIMDKGTMKIVGTVDDIINQTNVNNFEEAFLKIVENGVEDD